LHRNTLTPDARSQYNFSVFRDAGRVSATRGLSKPIRTVLKWQLIATAALTLVAWLWGGTDAALSAALGGAVSLCAGGMSAIVAATGRTQSAGGVLIAALLAEGVKIGLIVVLLWTVLVMVDDLVMPAFFGSFFATILLFSMAFFVREYK
jgi:ATP synthase protein I